jgi:Flp pilus assembly pilin Flp
MSHRTAAWLVTGTHHLAERVRRADAERGQGTVEYAGLAMAIGVLLLAVGSYWAARTTVSAALLRPPSRPPSSTPPAAAASRAGQRAALGVVATAPGAPPPR